MKMELTFRSGVQITVDVEKYTVGRSAFGPLTSLEWTTPAGAPERLDYLNVDDVVAIRALHPAADVPTAVPA